MPLQRTGKIIIIRHIFNSCVFKWLSLYSDGLQAGRPGSTAGRGKIFFSSPLALRPTQSLIIW
jgi:hypothetical protein